MTTLIRSICTTCFCSLLILSCSKSKDSGTSVDPCNLIDSVWINGYFNSYFTAAIEYDDRGRVKHVAGEMQNASTYTYYKDSIVLSATDIYGKNIGLTYYLNANGRVKGTSFFDNQYSYNADGYLVSYRQPYTYNDQIKGYTFYTLKYENGDLIEIATSDNNVSWKKINFKYYNEVNEDLLGYNQPLYTGSVLGDRNTFYLIKGGFFGKQSTHLYKTLAINGSWTNSEMLYSRDANGRITYTGDFTFKYKCP